MKERTDIYQISYNRGMIENIRQDMFFNNRQGSDSVLFLQNFNPNLESFSLTKRRAETRDETIENILLSDYLEQLKDNTLYVNHLMYLAISNPKFNDTLLLFFKRFTGSNGNDFYPGSNNATNDLFNSNDIESVGIVSYIQFENDINPQWYEPFKDGNIYKGWYPLGQFQDAVRYSESILFTTVIKKEDLTKFKKHSERRLCYPCYVWKYWDLTKKREDDNKYFTGIDFSPALDDPSYPIYTAWKVKKPSMELIRGNIAAGYFVSEADNNGDRNLHYTDFANISLPQPVEWKPISIVFWTDDLLENTWFDDKPIYQDKNLSSVKMTTTIESINHDAFMKYFIDTYLSSAITEYASRKTIEAGINYNVNTVEIGGSNDVIYDVGFYIDANGNRLTKIVNFYAEYMYREHVNRNFKVLQFGEYKHQDKPDMSKLGTLDGIISLTFLLPDYFTTEVPRPFIVKEEIPFILTAVVNGVEIILTKDIYTLHTHTGIINDENMMFSDGGNVFARKLSNFVVEEDVESSLKRDAKSIEIYSEKSSSYDKSILNPTNAVTEKRGKDFNKTYVAPLGIEKWKVVKFALRISEEGKQIIMDNDITSIKLYVSKPHEKETLIRSIGRKIMPIENKAPYYSKPAVSRSDMRKTDIDYSKFKLVKEFVIDGKGDIIDDYKNYNGRKSSKTNAWSYLSDDFDPNLPSNANPLPAFWSIPQEEEKLDAMSSFTNNIGGFKFYDQTVANYTPDFILWDYPNNSQTLELGGSGQYYEGIGARCITTIKGRTFIAGTKDKDNVEEQARVRYSVVQAGVISQDVFYKEHVLYFGHAPITALLEFREQLVVFNRNAWYRMLLHDITDPTSWEMLEAVEGSGTFSTKTVVNTPIGFAYAHDSGIFISEGNIAKNIVDDPESNYAILSLYQTVMFNKTYIYNDIIDIGEFPIDPEKGYNVDAELYYDISEKEIVLKSPVRLNNISETVSSSENPIYINFVMPDDELIYGNEFRLIYSLENRNWRTELYNRKYDDPTITPLPMTINKEDAIYTTNKVGKQSVSYLGLLTAIYNRYNRHILVTFNRKDIDSYLDMFQYLEHTSGGYLQIKDYPVDIESIIITHEIGNTQDDCLLHSAIISLAREKSSGYQEDPLFGYELRNREWNQQGYSTTNTLTDKYSYFGSYVDLIELNKKAKSNTAASIFDTKTITPAGIDTIETYSDGKIPIRESIILNTPRRTQFRRVRFKWLSKTIAKLKSIKITYIKRTRRRQ